MARSDTARENRKQWVGLLTHDPQLVLPEGAQVLEGEFQQLPAPTPMQGHITSSYYSPTVERSIALALIKGGLQRYGERVQVALRDGRNVPATIVSPVFFDPKGARQYA